MTRNELTDGIAAVWRSIGQPSTDGVFFLVSRQSREAEILDTTLLGAPCLIVSEFALSPLTVGVSCEADQTIPARFEAALRKSDLLILLEAQDD